MKIVNKDKLIVVLTCIIVIMLIIINTFIVMYGGYKLFNRLFINNNDNKTDIFYAARSIQLKKLKIYTQSTIMLGDSLTYNCEWHELLQNSNILNRGIGSETSSQLMLRIDDYTQSKPDNVFIMIGINDLRHGDNIDKISENIKTIISKINLSSPSTKIYIMSVLPCLYSNELNNKISKLNKLIFANALKINIKYVDLYSKFIDKDGSIVNKYYISDGLHLSYDGYLIWKQEIEKYLSIP